MSKGTVVDFYGTKPKFKNLLKIIQNQGSSAQYCYKQHAKGQVFTFFHPNRFSVASPLSIWVIWPWLVGMDGHRMRWGAPVPPGLLASLFDRIDLC